MRQVIVILAFFGGASAASAQDWRLDGSLLALAEAWDRNDSHEWLGGVGAGVDRRVWRGLGLRVEGLALRVAQAGQDAWLRGFSVGTRWRSRRAGVRPYLDVAVGLSQATRPVPPRGTRFNYLAAIGGGVEVPARGVVWSVAGRWFHVSNNGREGRSRNPDVQALGVSFGVGLEYP